MKNPILVLAIIIQTTNCFAQTVSTFFTDPSKKIDDSMVLDDQGNLYGSHFMGSNVYKVTPAGVATVFAGGFNTPNGLAFDSQNNLYVCDLSGNRIYKIDYSGVFLDTIFIPTPSGIIKSIDSDTMIFTQYTGNKISKLAPDGTVEVIASGAPMNGSVGLSYDDLGQLYVANFTDRKVYKINSSTLTYVATMPGPSNGALGFITFAQGTLWATSYNGHRIYRIYQNFVDSTVLYAGSTAGSVDGTVATAKFSAPNGIISSITGDSLYVSDFNTGRVRLISLNAFTGTKINKNAPISFSIYPNPASEYIQVDINEDFDMIEIIDLQGKIVLTSTQKTIYINELSNGEYILRINCNEEQGISKFIKS